MSRSVAELGMDKVGVPWRVEIDRDSPTDPLVWFWVRPAEFPKTRWEYPSASCAAHIESTSVAKIEDIVIKNPTMRNRGIGSLLLTFVERWMLNEGMVRLYGDLSNVDSNRFDQLRHSYQKYGWSFQTYQAGDPKFRKDSIIAGRVEKQLPRGKVH